MRTATSTLQQTEAKSALGKWQLRHGDKTSATLGFPDAANTHAQSYVVHGIAIVEPAWLGE
jgi:hypothetical protein